MEFLLFFLPLFLLVYGLTPQKAKNVTLLSGSLVFYALGAPKYLFLLMVSVLVNYLLGLNLGGSAGSKEKNDKYRQRRDRKRNRKRKTVLVFALLYNVGMLAAFKYGVIRGGLPPGISFYTFQILSYLLDVYRGDQKRETSFLMLASYITMFPQLLSGPIANYGELRGSMRKREFGAEGIQEGLKLFTMGLASKVLLADRVGLLWQEVQVTGFESISTPLAWIAAVAYSMKLYFDFYGYSLMASGLGRMLGFELPENFKNPYMASSVRDFYRRWHMSLGRWFTRYVYIPLGGNRKGEFRTMRNLLAVWVLTSIWHGSTVNFLIWGMLLWLAIAAERLLKSLRAARFPGAVEILGADKNLGAVKSLGKLFSHLYVLVFIPITWMCFEITDIAQLQVYLGRMFHMVPGQAVHVGDWRSALTDYGGLLFVGAVACTPLVQKIFRWLKDKLLGALLLALLFWLCVWRIQVEGNNPFMYLNF